MKRLFREDPEALALLRQLEVGAMPESEFERRLAQRLGLADASDLVDSMFRGMQPEPRMVEAVRAARKAGIKTGLLSNSWSTDHYDRALLGELFDDLVISAEVGLHKPQPEIFRLARERLAVQPAETVFVDDLRENVAGAEAVGMIGVVHRDPDETIARLEELLGVALREPADTARPPADTERRVTRR